MESEAWTGRPSAPQLAQAPSTRASLDHVQDPAAAAKDRQNASSPIISPDLDRSSAAEYSAGLCASPAASASGEPMDMPVGAATPPRTPPSTQGLPTAGGAVADISWLSFQHGHATKRSSSSRFARGTSTAVPVSSKRSASREFPGSSVQQTLQANPDPQPPHARTKMRSAASKGPGKAAYERHHFHSSTSGEALWQPMVETKGVLTAVAQGHDRMDRPNRVDSGYQSLQSRSNTKDTKDAPCPQIPPTVDESHEWAKAPGKNSDVRPSARNQAPSLILQPDSTPISPEQLNDEVKSIYAGLVMVEAKCISIDAAQAANPESPLGRDQWQALIALHRTLLYEHHDFLMATQHPSATPALSKLAVTYSMPARMWKHGIHAFLEVLRHRRPDSQDYMLSFIYLAYQMMALLLETVHCFTDTWIECLGDLARYRMAIEEEKEAHATWGGVAARWYTLASDHHPAIGRLYHHLGILERPSLRKLCLYGKSLTCVIPFRNARDSFSTLCGPIIQDEESIQSSSQSVEARFVTVHALIYSSSEQSTVEAVKSHALVMLRQHSAKLRDFGAYLAVTNTCALFEFGAADSLLLHQYTTAINQALHGSRPSPQTANSFIPVSQEALTAYEASLPFQRYKNLWVETLSVVLQNHKSTSLRHSMSYIHITLVSLHSLHSLRTRITNGDPNHAFRSSIDISALPWRLLAEYLNAVAEQNPIDTHVLDCARRGHFLTPKNKDTARPLPEDYIIRGLIWAQFYFCPDWFRVVSEGDGRAIETQSTHEARADRVLWLGLYMVFHAGYLEYNRSKKLFAVPTSAITSDMESVDATRLAQPENTERTLEASTAPSCSPVALSSSSNSDYGFHIVKNALSSHKSSPSSWAKVAAATPPSARPAKKQKHENRTFRIANDDDGVAWDEEASGFT